MRRKSKRDLQEGEVSALVRNVAEGSGDRRERVQRGREGGFGGAGKGLAMGAPSGAPGGREEGREKRGAGRWRIGAGMFSFFFVLL